MAQKKIVNVELSAMSELESEIQRATQILSNTNSQLADLGKLLTLLTSSYGKGSDLYTSLYEKSNSIEKSLKELGVPSNPIIDKAKKLAESLRDVGENKVRRHLFN